MGAVVLGAMLGCGTAPPPADLVLRNGAVYTVDSARPWAEAVAVRDGRIVRVGSDAAVAALIGTRTNVVDLAGRMLLPGFHDTHVHPVTGGIELGACDLNPARDRADAVRIVSACADHSDAAWVRGGGWQAPIFAGGVAPRELLDSLVPDRPAYLTAADAHSAWVNSRALAAAGVDRDTPDPPSGRIERGPDGRPSGTLRESAMGLVGRVMPGRTDAEYDAGLRRALDLATRFGITTLHEANADERIVAAYRRVADAAGLPVRAVVSLAVDMTAEPAAEVARLAALRARYAGGAVLPVAAKIFVDGVIEGQTAALLAPYADRPGYRGELNVDPDALVRLVCGLDSAGFKVHLHAIGDRAIRVSLDAVSAARRDGYGGGQPHVMAHIQLFDPADIPRLAELGVVASFQPLWAFADTYITDLTEPRLGPDRSRWLYPIASVVGTGAIVAAGSDWSVSSMNPLDGIEVAVTRRRPGDSTGPPWIAEERVDLATILHAYTMGGALAGGFEAETGSITVGKAADLVVLDGNLFTRPAHRIHDARVLLTLRDGSATYRDSTALAGR